MLNGRVFKRTDLLLIESFIYYLMLLSAFLIPLKKSVPEIVSLLIVLLIICIYIKRSSIKDIGRHRYVVISSFSFLIYIVIRSSSFFSKPEFDNIFRYTGILLIPLSVLGAYAESVSKELTDRCLIAFVISSTIISVYSFIAAFITGNYLNTAFMALFPISWYVGIHAFSAIFSLCLMDEYRSSRCMKLSFGITFFMALISIYMASRRGIILSLAASIAIIGYLRIQSFSRKSFQILIFSSLVLVIVFLINNPRFQNIHSTHDGYKYDIRLTMWKAALELSTENTKSFLFGYGLKQGYERYNQKVNSIEHYPNEMRVKFNSTHNDYLDIMIMFGAVGLSIFLFFLASLIHFGFANKNYLLISCVTMILIQFFFGSYFFWFRTGKFSLFFILSILLVYNRSFYTAARILKE